MKLLKVAFFTLGCKVNQYESQGMLEKFLEAGYEETGFDEEADVYVVNTCSVTGTSDRKSRQAISRARGRKNGAVVVAAGCYSELAKPEDVGADVIIGAGGKSRVVELVGEFLASRDGDADPDPVLAKAESVIYEEIPISEASGRTRAYLKIEDGCDNFCAYCIIPYARGRVRSRGIEDSLAEFRRLVAAGYREVVVTGIEVLSFGKDSGESFAELLRELDRIAGSTENPVRIRLGSLEPSLINDAIMEVFAGARCLCPQFHLSLQSGSEGVLRRMGRRYTADGYRALSKRIREAVSEAEFTTDIITGFPGETSAEFAESLEFVREMDFLKVHVFPFSPRPGTRAAGMDGQVSKRERQERAAQMRQMCDEIRKERIRSYIGGEREVLFEWSRGGVSEGYTASYVPVRVVSDRDLEGETARVLIKSLGEDWAEGELR